MEGKTKLDEELKSFVIEYIFMKKALMLLIIQKKNQLILFQRTSDALKI